MEEEESRKKEAKTSEISGESKASSTSNGPAVSQEEALRSRGGNPLSADLGRSVLETVERKIGDSDQGDIESKDKKNKTGKEEDKGTKRTVEDWDEHAKRLKVRAEARAEASKNPGQRMDVGYTDVAR